MCPAHHHHHVPAATGALPRFQSSGSRGGASVEAFSPRLGKVGMVLEDSPMDLWVGMSSLKTPPRERAAKLKVSAWP